MPGSSPPTEPNIQLPDIIGTNASLNLFVTLVSRSGGGKDTAAGVARAAVDIRSPGGQPRQLEVVPLGSGEGLSHVYMRPPPKNPRRRPVDEDAQAIGLGVDPDGATQYRTRALVTVKEVDTLDALMRRQGSTVAGQLRQAAMGDQLGFFYVDREKRVIVPEHGYRLCLLVGVQPGRGAALLNEADGGTPQRFIWLPATDPDMPRVALAAPPPLVWETPIYQSPQVVFRVCDQARDTIIDAHIARQRGDGDALDGHALLTRLKVAAGLALLEGDRRPQDRCRVTDEDWDLAGRVMAVSDATRASISGHLAAAAAAANEQRARVEAHRAVVVEDTMEQRELARAANWVLRRLTRDWVAKRDLRHAISSKLRPQLDDALDKLTGDGLIEVDGYTAGGQASQQYRLR